VVNQVFVVSLVLSDQNANSTLGHPDCYLQRGPN